MQLLAYGQRYGCVVRWMVGREEAKSDLYPRVLKTVPPSQGEIGTLVKDKR